MKAADTSLVVAAFASWHQAHDAARRALDGGLRLVEHCALETYSVLTRLPAPHRAAPMVVQGFLQSRFPQPFLRLTAWEHRAFVLGMAGLGVAGGSAYDALVAATVVACSAQLITCDKKALPVYERYGVNSRMIA